MANCPIPVLTKGTVCLCSSPFLQNDLNNQQLLAESLRESEHLAGGQLPKSHKEKLYQLQEIHGETPCHDPGNKLVDAGKRKGSDFCSGRIYEEQKMQNPSSKKTGLHVLPIYLPMCIAGFYHNQ